MDIYKVFERTHRKEIEGAKNGWESLIITKVNYERLTLKYQTNVMGLIESFVGRTL